MTSVWVWAELRPEGLHPSALELLTRARALGEASAVALGPGATAAVADLGAHGARTVYASDDPVFADALSQPAAHALHALVAAERPDLVLFPTTYDARDVAGRLQARTGGTLVANATDLPLAERVETRVEGGARVVTTALDGPAPRIVLVRPKSFAAEPVGGTARVVPVAADVPEDLRRARRVERHEAAAAGPRLEQARAVVAGGRGLGEASNFALLERLAALLGDAAVGATRAVVDAGWVPYSRQIGQTGKTVKPDVYLAFGISGATQHLVGMQGSRRIVAVNRDADAPILRLADLGVVGDALEVLPRLIAELEARAGDR
ncbi:MAG: electron transfer flavoprotein subunit alpha/FixB family protein [Actinomycetota bacterium]